MGKKFLKTIALSAVICSFGSIDLIKADECVEDYEKVRDLDRSVRKNGCEVKKTCRFGSVGGKAVKCYEDKCKPHDGDQSACAQHAGENCTWKQNKFCVYEKTEPKKVEQKKKGPSNFSNY